MSNTYEIEGKILEVLPIEEISATFSKRVVVLDMPCKNPEYTEKVPFEFIQQNINKVEGFKAGDIVKIRFGLKGRAWQDRYFASNGAFSISLVGGHGHQGQGDQDPERTEFNEEITDEVPF